MHAMIVGHGYVGAALGEVLLQRGHRVAGVRRRWTDAAATPPGLVRCQADATQPETLAALPADVDALVYCVSADERSDAAYRAAYVDGVGNVLEVLRRCGAPLRRVVLVSSTAVYGSQEGDWVDESSVAAPRDFSGQRLLEGERLLASFAAQQAAPFEATVLRLSGIYGPGRTRLIEQVATGKARRSAQPKYGNRLHRDDCAGFIAHLLELERPAALYIGVDDAPEDMNVVMEWMAARLGVALQGPEEPTADAVTAAASSPERRGSQHKRCSNRRLHDSGYRLLYPTFRDGYAAIIAAYLGRKML